MMYMILGHASNGQKLVSRVFRNTSHWVGAENALLNHMQRITGEDYPANRIRYNEHDDIAVTVYEGVEYTCLKCSGSS